MTTEMVPSSPMAAYTLCSCRQPPSLQTCLPLPDAFTAMPILSWSPAPSSRCSFSLRTGPVVITQGVSHRDLIPPAAWGCFFLKQRAKSWQSTPAVAGWCCGGGSPCSVRSIPYKQFVDEVAQPWLCGRRQSCHPATPHRGCGAPCVVPCVVPRVVPHAATTCQVLCWQDGSTGCPQSYTTTDARGDRGQPTVLGPSSLA